VPQFRQAHHPDPQGLRETLARAIGVFEQKAQAHGVPHEHLIAARYALCTFLDEAAANTPWGDKVWAQRSLLVQFHNEAWGGEKFFQLLGKLAENPAPTATCSNSSTSSCRWASRGATGCSRTAAPSSPRCASGWPRCS
jgi:type IV/VI secretion system ImpK/VasF family protein